MAKLHRRGSPITAGEPSKGKRRRHSQCFIDAIRRVQVSSLPSLSVAPGSRENVRVETPGCSGHADLVLKRPSVRSTGEFSVFPVSSMIKAAVSAENANRLAFAAKPNL